MLLTRELIRSDTTAVVGCTLACMYLLLKCAQATVEYFNHLRRLQVHRGVQVSLYRVINSKLLHMDAMASAAHSKGHLKTLIGSDVESIEDFISAALSQWTAALVTTVILIPALFIVSGWVGLFALFVGVLLLPLAVVGAKCVEYFQKRSQAEQDSLITLVGEWVKNIRLVRFLGWQEAIERDVVARMRRYAVLGAVRHFVIIVVFAVSFSWSMLPLLALFMLSSYGTRPLDLAQIFSTFWILDHLMVQIQMIPHSLSMFGSAAAGATRILEFLAVPNLDRFFLKIPASDGHLSGRPTKVCLQGVSLNYGQTEALCIPHLEISLTEKTAIVGIVGSGKSTLLELIVGEKHPTSGSIDIEFAELGDTHCNSNEAIHSLETQVENAPTRRIPLWREDAYLQFRATVAYAPQQPFLSNTTLRLNIDLSGVSSEEDLEFATVASQLKPDLLLFPRAYGEEVGESGINLSGGQKQRISLARAFISGRQVMVLDDPLSAVDAQTEVALMDALFASAKGLILVSHRINELERCDRVLVLDGGRIVEDGVPAVLAADETSRLSSFLKAVELHEH